MAYLMVWWDYLALSACFGYELYMGRTTDMGKDTKAQQLQSWSQLTAWLQLHTVIEEELIDALIQWDRRLVDVCPGCGKRDQLLVHVSSQQTAILTLTTCWSLTQSADSKGACRHSHIPQQSVCYISVSRQTVGVPNTRVKPSPAQPPP